MAPTADTVRFGHAYFSDQGREDELAAVREALEIAAGREALQPRRAGNDDVLRAEELLEACDPRPIYAYLGDLHPALGKVGLVVGRTWVASERLQGLSHCDSGGVAARCAGFGCLQENEVEKALLELSSPAPCDGWEQHFGVEVEQAYGGDAARYVRGETPALAALDEYRRRFVSHAEAQEIEDKRRLWTWEFRFSAAPTQEEFVAFVCTRNALKELNELRRKGWPELPENVAILGQQHDSLADAFSSEHARHCLGGEQLGGDQ
jgi:hypothetical protein